MAGSGRARTSGRTQSDSGAQGVAKRARAALFTSPLRKSLGSLLGLSVLGFLSPLLLERPPRISDYRVVVAVEAAPAAVEPVLSYQTYSEPRPLPAPRVPVEAQVLAALDPALALPDRSTAKRSSIIRQGNDDGRAGAKAADWRQFAAAYQADYSKPWIAIVIDDVGVNRQNAAAAVALPAPLTLAFMTYADNLEQMTGQARRKGHELLLHFPMEPQDLANNDPGENALFVGLPEEELERRLTWGLHRFSGYVGVNNHMGSRFTRNRAGMRQVIGALRDRGLLFLDSRTTGGSVAASQARQMGVTALVRDVFLDHEPTADAVRRQLLVLEKKALDRGYAIAIGHPLDFTLDVLRDWLPLARARGFDIVPLSAIALRLEETG